MYSGAMLIDLLQRKKVSPKGFPFARCAAGLTTSLAARSDCLVGYRQTGWLLSFAILWPFASAVSSSLACCGRLVTCVIALLYMSLICKVCASVLCLYGIDA